MSNLDTQTLVRTNDKQRVKFNKLAKTYGMSASALHRVLMDAAIDGTLRIVVTPKTKTIIPGVHINV